MTVEKLITDHIDVWSSALQTRSTAGRGSKGKIDLYGIKKLRELILELAVRGKLVPQDPNDEPASELLKRIADEKAELVKQGKIKKQKPLPDISENEKPFELPVGWEWVRLGNVANIFNGSSVSSSDKENKYFQKGGRPFIATKDVGYGFNELNYSNGMEIPHEVNDLKVAKKNSVLICAEGGSAGKKCGVTNQDVCFGNKLFASECYQGVEPFYILSNFLSPSFFSAFQINLTGIIGGVSTSKFKELLIPLSSSNEQKRIINRITELMSLCDKLEKQSLVNLNSHQQLVETLLETLTDSQNAEQLAENWARIGLHFDALFTTEASIEALKKTILQLAVMGKLVPQDPNDESASELLKRIEQEKAQQVREKKLKKQKPLPRINEDEKYFELPEGWVWCRVEDIGDLKLGRQRSPKDHHGPHMTPYLRVANVHDDKIRIDDVKFMNFTPDERAIFSLQHGDILLNEGQSLELVGRSAIFKNEIAGACFQNTLIRLRVKDGISNEYVLAYFRYCLYSERFQKAATQTTNIAHLSVSRLAPIEFPLPSYNEQLKIVLKIRELEILCEKMKMRVKSAQQTQLHLADALTDAALN